MNPATPPDLQAPVHKALRLALAQTATALGHADAGDSEALATLTQLANDALDALVWHAEVEAVIVFPLLEAADPGATSAAAEGHRRLARQMAQLRDAVDALQCASAVDQATLLARLYRHWTLTESAALALLHGEETALHAALCRAVESAALHAARRELIRRIPPDGPLVAWLAGALNPEERATWLAPHPQETQHA
jgi:hypothetical protein